MGSAVGLTVTSLYHTKVVPTARPTMATMPYSGLDITFPYGYLKKNLQAGGGGWGGFEIDPRGPAGAGFFSYSSACTSLNRDGELTDTCQTARGTNSSINVMVHKFRERRKFAFNQVALQRF